MNSAASNERQASSTQIVARRVDIRDEFARKQSAPAVPVINQRLASGALILSSLAGFALTLVGHL